MVKTLATSLLVDKGNHRHFMAKEIYEQPEVVGHTLAHYLDFAAGRTALPADFAVDFAALDRLSITACGTAFYAGLVAKYWFERFARLPVDIDIASEFRYREQPLAARACRSSSRSRARPPTRSPRSATPRAQGQKVAAIVNVQESTIAREADFVLPTLAGPEIGVASTKAFTSQLAVLGVARGRRRTGARRPLRGGRGEARPRAQRSAALHEPGAPPRAADREAGARASRASSTCSISAAAPAIRSRWKAR